MLASSAYASEMTPLRFNTDRPGNDYKSFIPHRADAALCQDQCAVETRCKAWTFFNNNCFLKDPAPGARSLTGAISGVKTSP
jgi:hypothetical protein